MISNKNGFFIGGQGNGSSDGSDLHKVAISGDYNDLDSKPTIPVVPSKLSEFNNDSGFINGIYNNSTSGLTATTIQGAIDELKVLFDSLASTGE